ncbi:MAG: ABC transporter permease [Clostridia bacterium]|nr:ABC transporter permease [Clostridia bacterium]
MFKDLDKKKLKVCGIIFLLCLALVASAGVIELVISGFSGRLEFIHAGDRWSSDSERYATIALYSEEGAISTQDVENWVHSMDEKLIEASITPHENASSWAWTASGHSELSLMGPKSSENAVVTVTMGDFFVFHPMKYTYGTAYLNDDSNPMGIVLDRNLAWRLFGAENIIGMTLSVGDYDYVVTGIASPESDSGPYGSTYGTGLRAYMSYAGFSKVSSVSLTCFEAALPDAVKGFAKNIFDSAVTFDQQTASACEVSDRFSIKNRWDRAGELQYSLTRQNKVEYPYWENEARIYDYHASVLTIVQFVLLIAAAICLLLSLIFLGKSGFSPWKIIRRITAKHKIRNLEIQH